MLTVATPRFASAAGFFASMPDRTAGAMTVRSVSDFAAITWLSLTNDPLAVSRRSLITLATRAQNTNQVWDGVRTLHDHWGTAPVLLQPVRAELTLHIAADSLHLYPLGVRGEAQGGSVTILPSASDRRVFEVTLDQSANPSVWYGIEAFGEEVPSHVRHEESAVSDFALRQNYPNPFNPSTMIAYDLPHESHVRLTVHDVLGREVAVIVNEEQSAGTHRVTFGSGRISSGMYFYHLQAGSYSAQRMMLVIK
ncbi:MAG TPA: T9SS type A sorting domain-containing protein, partial [Bacteroidota bacterium]|nr:T9SS type A sorting domain-containing protein [Bacteroidota bacterium]